MHADKRLLLANRAWAEERLSLKPDYFQQLIRHEPPEFLWIGCAEATVPPDEVVATAPGEIFVHRNLANLVVHTDLNLMSVLQHAVETLKVKHVIVCGHYGCGGVDAALGHARLGLKNKWLRHLKDIYRTHSAELGLHDTHERRAARLTELNVLEQVQNLVKTSIVQRAWHNHQRPALHGWVFDPKNGRIRDLLKVEAGAPMEDIYRYDFSDGEDGTE